MIAAFVARVFPGIESPFYHVYIPVQFKKTKASKPTTAELKTSLIRSD
jgi:hypothetical protein